MGVLSFDNIVTNSAMESAPVNAAFTAIKEFFSGTTASANVVITGSFVSLSVSTGVITSSTLTASRAVVSDGSKSLISSDTTLTELSYVSGVTSAIQTQINTKIASSATLVALSAFSSTGLMALTAPATFAARTITGVTNRTTITNGNGVADNPTIDISASYAGQSSIVTIGTLASTLFIGGTSGFSVGSGLSITRAGACTIRLNDSVGGTACEISYLDATGLNLSTLTTRNIVIAPAASTVMTFTASTKAVIINNPSGSSGFFLYRNGESNAAPGVQLISDSSEVFLSSWGTTFKILTGELSAAPEDTLASFSLTSSGLAAFPRIHNNAAAFETSALPAIRSGTFTPTASDGVNVTESTTQVSNWFRVGNIVRVDGHIDVTTTDSGVLTTLELTLPVTSNLASDINLAGDVKSRDVAQNGSVYGNSTSNKAILSFLSSGAYNKRMAYGYSYEVLS